MSYSFTEIFDIPKLSELCESFTRINGTVTALLDLEGNVHIKTGWQQVCTQFHRVNPKSSARCLESDTVIASKLSKGEKYNVYQCKNGLVDIAVPIYVDNQHVANFFTGQFLFQQPDNKYFNAQAKELGVELIPYMDALRKVPVFSEDEIKKIMNFLVILAQTIGEMGKARLDLIRLREHEMEQHEELKRKSLELSMARDHLEKLALEDPLTGLYNRRFFDKQLVQEFHRAKRLETSLVLCLFDIDKFKTINDTFGHFIGDEILKRITGLVSANFRKSDTISRIGGDEFSILFPEADVKQIEDTLENVRHIISKDSLNVEGERIHTSCSFGIASLSVNDKSERELFERADLALYKSKTSGRNLVSYIEE